jgi:hypothetical protein
VSVLVLTPCSVAHTGSYVVLFFYPYDLYGARGRLGGPEQTVTQAAVVSRARDIAGVVAARLYARPRLSPSLIGPVSFMRSIRTYVVAACRVPLPRSVPSLSKRAAQVLAASTDSHFVHLAWINTPRSQGGLGKMNIPILADTTKQISRDYGVLLEGEGVALRLEAPL